MTCGGGAGRLQAAAGPVACATAAGQRGPASSRGRRWIKCPPCPPSAVDTLHPALSIPLSYSMHPTSDGEVPDKHDPIGPVPDGTSRQRVVVGASVCFCKVNVL